MDPTDVEAGLLKDMNSSKIKMSKLFQFLPHILT